MYLNLQTLYTVEDVLSVFQYADLSLTRFHTIITPAIIEQIVIFWNTRFQE